MNYNVREGKELLNSKETLSRNVFEKWNQIFSPNFKLKWQDVWVKRRKKKKVGCFGLCGTRPLLKILGGKK
jgi:hypothetical protein